MTSILERIYNYIHGSLHRFVDQALENNSLALFDQEVRDMEEAIEHVTAALEAEEFGVVSRIDLHASFKKKLGVDTKPHAILKVCNPKLAHQAVTALPEVALLLPCSVTIQSVRENLTVVRIGNPQTFMSGVGVDANPVVKKVGGDADAHLRRVAEALRTSTAE